MPGANRKPPGGSPRRFPPRYTIAMEGNSGAFAQELSPYRTLPPSDRLDSVFETAAARNVIDIPDDWTVFLSDVVGSTNAIAAGRYKDVNTAGSLPVMAIANLVGDMNFPFIFGGDGMTAVLPPGCEQQVRAIMRDTRRMARELFDIELRTGAVPVRELRHRNAGITVAAVRVSDRYRQAVFFGTGLDLAEEMVKGRSQGSAQSWIIPDDPGAQPAADFSGFSCRWQDIPSALGLTFALVVKPGLRVSRDDTRWVDQVLGMVKAAIGDDDAAHPLSVEGQRPRTLAEASRLESRVHQWARRGLVGFLARAATSLGVILRMSAGKLILRWRLPMKYQGQMLREIRENNRLNSDVRKFDGSLKLIASATAEGLDQLEKTLSLEEKEGTIVYGIHRSDRAHMTCMIHTESSGEVHFVDGADGGYALAAKMLKEKLAAPSRGMGGR